MQTAGEYANSTWAPVVEPSWFEANSVRKSYIVKHFRKRVSKSGQQIKQVWTYSVLEVIKQMR